MTQGAGEGLSLLTVLLAWPLLVAVVLVPLRDGRIIQRVALVGAFVELAVALSMFVGFSAAPTSAFQFEERLPWIEAIGASIHLGVDGLSAPFLPLTALLTVVAVAQARTTVSHRQKAYLMSVLAFSTASTGVFTALDLALFFVFWELMLVPTFVLIKLWGTGPGRSHAATKYVLAMLMGSVTLLAAFVLLSVNHRTATGSLSFDYLALLEVDVPPGLGVVVFFLMAFSFMLKAPLFPLHSWLPPALQEGPIGIGILLAGLKVGVYGFLRLIMPLVPDAFMRFRWLIAVLAVIAILYGGLAALAQPDLRRLIAFAGVSHVGLALLGLSSGNADGVAGAVFLLANLGLTAAGLLLIAGFIHQRLGTTDVVALGGLASRAPALTAFALIFAFAEAALPGTSGFPGEFLALLGAFREFGALSLIALMIVVLAAGYSLIWLQRAFYGPITRDAVNHVVDLGRREAAVAFAIAAVIVLLGLAPSIVLDPARPSVTQLVDRLDVVDNGVAAP
ncbi:MAG TPA: NADH-quinone oxidoreductase subunit M [Actinomycetota bacterium]|nr:NADH-quinone oxidoreductase subunit M [Actinomycetota bacterium]